VAAALADNAAQIDRFQLYESLLLPLENVKQPLRYHPEGDALYHSLQVFDLARNESAYDEEFLVAALLHDVGKAIDPADHVAAALEALDGFITERTAWLVEHHMLAHQLVDGTLGARARRRLQESEHFDDLVLLGECDRAGRVPGVVAPELEEALDYLRELDTMFG
jgi:predicted HD phosphohydrolase